MIALSFHATTPCGIRVNGYCRTPVGGHIDPENRRVPAPTRGDSCLASRFSPLARTVLRGAAKEHGSGVSPLPSTLPKTTQQTTPSRLPCGSVTDATQRGGQLLSPVVPHFPESEHLPRRQPSCPSSTQHLFRELESFSPHHSAVLDRAYPSEPKLLMHVP